MSDFDKSLEDKVLKGIENLDESKLITKIFYPKTYVLQVFFGVVFGILVACFVEWSLSFTRTKSSFNAIMIFTGTFFAASARYIWIIKNLLNRIKELENKK